MLVEATSARALECACVQRSLERKAWENDCIGQLDGVGAKTREKLVELGIAALEDLLRRGDGVVTAKVGWFARVR